MDGESLVNLLKSGGSETLKREALYWHFPHYRHGNGPYSIIRSGPWKLIRWYEGQKELYNLAEDPSELNDLLDTMPTKVGQLDVLLSAELKRIGAKLPRANPEYAP